MTMPSSTVVSTTRILLMPSSAICLTTALDSGSKARATTTPLSLSTASSIKTLFWMSSSFSASFTLRSSIVVKQLEDVRVRPVAEGAEESRGQEFAAALFAVEINVEQIAGVKLRLIPGTAIGNDAEGMERLAVGMLGRFKGQAGRAMQLADDDALGAVDDKSALRRHQRQFAHEHFFFLGALLLLEQEGDVQRRAVGDAFAQALQPVVLRLADFVAVKIQDALAIVTFDGKNLGEDRLQARVLALGWRGVGLQEFPVGIGLQLDQVRRGDDLFDFSEMDAFS